MWQKVPSGGHDGGPQPALWIPDWFSRNFNANFYLKCWFWQYGIVSYLNELHSSSKAASFQVCISRLLTSQTEVTDSFKCSSLLTSQLRCNSWNERTNVNWAISRTTINDWWTTCQLHFVESTARPACLNLPPGAHRLVCRCEKLEKELTFQLHPIIFYRNIVPMFKFHIFSICNSLDVQLRRMQLFIYSWL